MTMPTGASLVFYNDVTSPIFTNDTQKKTLRKRFDICQTKLIIHGTKFDWSVPE